MVGANCLLYLNQSSPAFGISLNSISESTTHFPLRSQGSICLSMDCSQATFISGEQLVVSLRGGEIYVLLFIAPSPIVPSLDRLKPSFLNFLNF